MTHSLPNILFVASVFAVALIGSDASAAIIDFTENGNADSAGGTFVDDFDLFGDGTLTLDLTISATGGSPHAGLAGWANDGPIPAGSSSDRLGGAETLIVAFSDLQGSLAPSVTGFEMIGLIIRGEANLAIDAGESASVNGVAVIGDNGNDNLVVMAHSTGSRTYESNPAVGPVVIGANGSFTIQETTPSGGGTRIGGLEISALTGGGPSIPAPAALPAGLALLVAMAARRFRA